MSLLLLITDSAALPAFERALLSEPALNFTIVPEVEGHGHSGWHFGTRVHPGGSSLLFAVVPDDQDAAALAFLRATRDQAGARDTTRLYRLPAQAVD
jgi:hypothetical protein